MSGEYADAERDRAGVKAFMLNAGMSEEEAEEQVRGLHDGEPVPARLRRLSTVVDELGIGRIDLLKIDVERAEMDVLAGIDDRHWESIRQLVVEIHDEDGRLGRVCTQLEELGFGVTPTQEGPWVGTPLHMLYARRP
jgi:hypothetical protein